MGLSDYTLSMARRFTEWFWVAISFQMNENDETGSTCGLQLSDGVYKSAENASDAVINLENIMWIDQDMYLLNCSLQFSDALTGDIISPGQRQVVIGRDIRISSGCITGNQLLASVNLLYTPLAQMPTSVSTPIFYGSLLHTYGIYSGSFSINGTSSMKTCALKNIPGIFEDHYAHW